MVHAGLPIPIADRDLAVRFLLRALLLTRRWARERSEAAKSTKHLKHRSTDLETGFGGKGAPIAELDRRARGGAGVDRDGQPNHVADSFRAALVVPSDNNDPVARAMAEAVLRAVNAGAGRRTMSSPDTMWHLMARSFLVPYEIGWVITTANVVERLSEREEIDNAVLRAALDALRPIDLNSKDAQETIAEWLAACGASVETMAPIAGSKVERESARRALRSVYAKILGDGVAVPTADSYANLADDRWQRTRARGFADPQD